jgi:hypothetical protein
MPQLSKTMPTVHCRTFWSSEIANSCLL